MAFIAERSLNKEELLEVIEDEAWIDAIISGPVSIAEDSVDAHLRGKKGRITEVVIPNSDPCVFAFQPEDGSPSEWVFFEHIVINK